MEVIKFFKNLSKSVEGFLPSDADVKKLFRKLFAEHNFNTLMLKIIENIFISSNSIKLSKYQDGIFQNLRKNVVDNSVTKMLMLKIMFEII